MGFKLRDGSSWTVCTSPRLHACLKRSGEGFGIQGRAEHEGVHGGLCHCSCDGPLLVSWLKWGVEWWLIGEIIKHSLIYSGYHIH